MSPQHQVIDLVCAAWCHRGVISEGRIPEWAPILQHTDTSLEQALLNVSRLRPQQLQGALEVGKQRMPLVDVMSAITNMIAVYVGRSFTFVRDKIDEKGLEELFQRYKSCRPRLHKALALLEPLRAVDVAHRVVLHKHLRVLSSALDTLVCKGHVSNKHLPAVHRWHNEREQP